MMKKCFLFTLLISFPCWGQIEQVVVQWEQNICDATCQAQLTERLAKIPQVEKASLLPVRQQVALEWKENQPFYYQSINNAIKWVGLTIDQVRLVVTGKIKEIPARFSGDPQIMLISEGDNTPFALLSPIQANPDQYTPRFALESHRLTPQMYQELLSLMQKNAEVSIEGPLYSPFRYTSPLYLIIEKMSGKEDPG